MIGQPRNNKVEGVIAEVSWDVNMLQVYKGAVWARTLTVSIRRSDRTTPGELERETTTERCRDSSQPLR